MAGQSLGLQQIGHWLLLLVSIYLTWRSVALIDQILFKALWTVDYVETLPTEIHSIWKQKKTGTSILFLMNRYIFILYIIFKGVECFPGHGTNKHMSEIASLDFQAFFQSHNLQNSLEVIVPFFIMWTNFYLAMRFFTDLFYRLPNLFISHLVLNLRIFSRPGNTVISQRTKTSVSSLNFASSQMLGNIGAPLDGTSFAEKEDEEEENGAEIEMEAIEEHSEANEN
ncbi:hypothetical protein F5879DRAFT_813551 [Lentinula edodes]|nr:hypothetical protein F5879DRAFT_813551 [Lentinula edodes]